MDRGLEAGTSDSADRRTSRRIRKSTRGPLLGAHMSIAGGYHRAVVAAALAGCDVVQLFTKNNTQWRAKPITLEEQAAFQNALTDHNIRHPVAHACYLINLASGESALWHKSVDAFVEELRRAELLGLEHVVIHPGSFVQGCEDDGIARAAKAINECLRRTAKLRAGVLLETTAGQGTALGWRFEHLAAILERLRRPERVGVCLDTCHLFAAGYAIHTRKGYNETMRSLRRLIGLERVKAIHLNDSRRELGSRVDRHAHIGRGKLGLRAFGYFLNDARFRRVPMYLETPKGQENGEDLDRVNLRALRGLVRDKTAATR